MTSERFNKAYNALVNAFFNGTLAKDSCTACAVGNIIADAQGGEIKYLPNLMIYKCTTENNFWIDVFCTRDSGQIKHYLNKDTTELNKRIKDLTDYSHIEMSEVELVFEQNTKIKFEHYQIKNEREILEDQYNGLCAVVDVLLSFEEEKIEAESYKNKFKEHPKLVSHE